MSKSGMLTRSDVINSNTRTSPAMVIMIIVGVMMCAIAAPLFPFFLIGAWLFQRHFNQRRRQLIGHAREAARLKARRDKILAFKSLPKLQ